MFYLLRGCFQKHCYRFLKAKLLYNKLFRHNRIDFKLKNEIRVIVKYDLEKEATLYTLVESLCLDFWKTNTIQYNLYLFLNTDSWEY